MEGLAEGGRMSPKQYRAMAFRDRAIKQARAGFSLREKQYHSSAGAKGLPLLHKGTMPPPPSRYLQ